MPRIYWLAVGVLGATVAAACGSAPSPAADGDGSKTLTVAAASSLTDAGAELAEQFERSHPEATVRLNLGSSSVLARQILEGAPASVLVTADEASMDQVIDAGLLDAPPVVVAGNELVLISQPGLDPPVEDLDDLATAAVVALCTSTAPCGRLADDVLSRADVSLAPDRLTRAPNARATLRAVSDGDAEAGLVYATDARSVADAVRTQALPEALRVQTDYPAAVVAGQADPALAAEFVEFLQGQTGREILARHGFSTP